MLGEAFAKVLVERSLGLLRSLIKEAVIFAAGMEMAEAHPEAAVRLARACMELVADAVGQLKSPGGGGGTSKKAFGELEIARDLFGSVVVGEPASPLARKYVRKGPREGGS
jgi:hypothetical protein